MPSSAAASSSRFSDLLSSAGLCGGGTRALGTPPAAALVSPVDGRELCKWYMRGACSEPCPHDRAHLPLAARPHCPDWIRLGQCRRGDACFLRHCPNDVHYPNAEASLVLQVSPFKLERVFEYLEGLLGEGTISSLGGARKSDSVLFLQRVDSTSMDQEEDGKGMLLEALLEDAHISECVIRIYNVQSTSVTAEEAAAEIERALLEHASAPPRVRIRSYPNDLMEIMGEELHNRGKVGLAMKGYSHIVDVVRLRSKIYWGVHGTSEAGHMDLNFTSLFAKKREKPEFLNGAQPVCKALWKLHEACQRAGITFSPTTLAVDVGCAPGGWTQYMAAQMSQGGNGVGGLHEVTGHIWAIDKGLLELEPLPLFVSWVPHVFDDALADLEKGLGGRQLQVVVCDANFSPGASLGIVGALVKRKLIDSGAWLVLTLKNFCKNSKIWEEECKQVQNILNEACCRQGDMIVQPYIIHLLNNGISERTLITRCGASHSFDGELLIRNAERCLQNGKELMEARRDHYPHHWKTQKKAQEYSERLKGQQKSLQ